MSRTALALLALAALLGFWCLGAHNRLVRLRHAITQAWVAVDAQLQRRHALARELADRLAVPEAQPAVGDELAVAAVQMLAAAVRQAETAAAHARTRAAQAGAIQSLALAEQVLDNSLRPLALLIHARGRLLQRAGLHDALRELLQREPEIEHQAAFARRLFNTAVADYNGAIDELPTRLLAGPMRFAPAAGFQTATPDGSRLAPLPPAESVPSAVPEVLALPVVDMPPSTLAAVGDEPPIFWPASTIDLSASAVTAAAAPETGLDRRVIDRRAPEAGVPAPPAQAR
jgi:LemA protein